MAKVTDQEWFFRSWRFCCGGCVLVILLPIVLCAIGWAAVLLFPKP